MSHDTQPYSLVNRQVRRPSLSGELSHSIMAMVKDRGLTIGDPLPNAKVLAQTFNVATPTIREALRSLEATGTVEMRHGSGVYVGANLSRMVLANPHAYEVDGDIVLQMVETRLLIEPTLAAMAADRHLDAKTLERLRRSCSEDSQERADSTGGSMNFHRELANVAGNVVMAEVVDSVLSIRWREQKAIRRMFDDREHDLAQHRQILRAVADHDAQAARDLTERHLIEIREAVSKRDVQRED